ncbi:unnamed protein product, partial [Callosobruchus maculatus]
IFQLCIHLFTNFRTSYTVTVLHTLLDFASTDSTYHFTVAVIHAATMLCIEITRHRYSFYTVYYC